MKLKLDRLEHRLNGNISQEVLRRFLNDLRLDRQGKLLVMPVMELVHHSPKATN